MSSVASIFAVPSDLKNFLLYCWRIINQVEILEDDLITFLAFDLSLAPLDTIKSMIEKGKDERLLIFDEKSLTISLNKHLKEEFDQWQTRGLEKMKKMNGILSRKWRNNMEITDQFIFETMLNFLVDEHIRDQANKIRASRVKIETIDFTKHIKGIIKDTVGVKPVEYPFEIDINNKNVYHKCPDWAMNRKKSKMLCKHLVRVIFSLYNDDDNKQNILELLIKIAENLDDWTFS